MLTKTERWILLLQNLDVIIRDQKKQKIWPPISFQTKNPSSGDKLREQGNHWKHFRSNLLGSVALRVDSTSWFQIFANDHAGISCQGMSPSPTEKQVFPRCQTHSGIPLLVQNLAINVRRVCHGKRKHSTFSKLATMDPPGDITVQISPPKRSLMPDSFGLQYTKMHTSWLKTVTRANDKEKFHKGMKPSKFHPSLVKSWNFGHRYHGTSSHLPRATKYLLWLRLSCKMRFGAPVPIIRARGTHFCNDQCCKGHANDGVTHRLSTAYHPQTSGRSRIFEASRARGICPSITRASQSSASFGNPDILILSTNVYL
ncbi:reverse transcriptase domain-containing protein [Tanacetum coccineum]